MKCLVHLFCRRYEVVMVRNGEDMEEGRMRFWTLRGAASYCVYMGMLGSTGTLDLDDLWRANLRDRW